MIALLLLQLILCAFIILVIIMSIINRNSSKGKIGSPFSELPSLPLIGPLHHIFLNRHDVASLLIKWRKNHGTCWQTIIFGKEILMIHDPDMLKSLLESWNPGHLQKFSFIYDILFVGAANNGLLSMPARPWIKHRKVMNSLFTYAALKNYIGIFEKHANQFVQDLSACNNNHKNVSYSSCVHVKTMDIIAEIAIGVPMETVIGRLGCLEFHKDMKAISEIMSNKIFAKPWQLQPFIWRCHSESKRLEKSVQAVETVVRKIREKYKPNEKSNFALDMMIDANWSDEEIISELLTLLVAGFETVSSNFILHLWMLALEQEHQAACQKEVDQVFDAMEISGETLSISWVSKMKYLERCVKESLRLFPSTPFGTGRELGSPLKLNNDTILKPGTVVMFSTYVLHRDPNTFPNPEQFNPDRFLPENVKNRSTHSYLPFSSGPRNCLGWKMALLELSVLTAVILRHFHLETTDRREDISILFSHILFTSREPNIVFRRRR